MFRKKTLLCWLFLAATFNAVSTQAMDRDEYVAHVIDVLRTHAGLMEELVTGNRFKYSDNLVRHAIAIRDSFGLLGPMEWHAAQSAALHAKEPDATGEEDDSEHLTEEMFEELGRSSQRSLKDLVRAAHDSMESYDQRGVLKAINELKASCTNCHSLLPEGVAPDVWGTVKSE